MVTWPCACVSDAPLDSVSVATGGTSDTTHVPVFFATKCFAGFRSLSDREDLDRAPDVYVARFRLKLFSQRLFVPQSKLFSQRAVGLTSRVSRSVGALLDKVLPDVVLGCGPQSRAKTRTAKAVISVQWRFRGVNFPAEWLSGLNSFNDSREDLVWIIDPGTV